MKSKVSNKVLHYPLLDLAAISFLLAKIQSSLSIKVNRNTWMIKLPFSNGRELLQAGSILPGIWKLPKKRVAPKWKNFLSIEILFLLRVAPPPPLPTEKVGRYFSCICTPLGTPSIWWSLYIALSICFLFRFYNCMRRSTEFLHGTQVRVDYLEKNQDFSRCAATWKMYLKTSILTEASDQSVFTGCQMTPWPSNKMAYANSMDPDQTASSGAVWLGSTLFAFPLSVLTLVLLNKLRCQAYF